MLLGRKGLRVRTETLTKWRREREWWFVDGLLWTRSIDTIANTSVRRSLHTSCGVALFRRGR
jgi:hypothetical protein